MPTAIRNAVLEEVIVRAQIYVPTNLASLLAVMFVRVQMHVTILSIERIESAMDLAENALAL